jgi:hypothetical protein
MNKKEEELEVASFFLEKINQEHDLDYFPELNLDETKGESDVDVYALSVSKKYPKLKLQLTTADDEVKEKEAKFKKECKQGKRASFFADVTPKRCISRAVTRKDKHSGKDEIIFVIHSRVGGITNEEYTKKNFSGFVGDTDYKGVYFVLLPDHTSAEKHNGQLTSIKECFNNKISKNII